MNRNLLHAANALSSLGRLPVCYPQQYLLSLVLGRIRNDKMSSQTSSSAAGPSRIPYKQDSTMAPSTSGDSETTNRPVHEKGLDVGILRDLAKASLVEQLNDVRVLPHVNLSLRV